MSPKTRAEAENMTMFGMFKRKKIREPIKTESCVSFGTISHGDLMKLMQGLGDLRRYLPRFIAERQKGMDVLRSIDEYHRIQHSLEAFANQWSANQLRLMAGEMDIPLELDTDAAPGFALALVDLALVCRAVPNEESLLIADIADTLLTKYQNTTESGSGSGSGQSLPSA